MTNRDFPTHCYYCDTVTSFNNADHYERHIVTKHPGYPGYPGPADLKLYTLSPQGMSWEREISEAEALEILRNYIPRSERIKRRTKTTTTTTTTTTTKK